MNIKIKLSGNPDWHNDTDLLWAGDIPGGESLSPGSIVTMLTGAKQVPGEDNPDLKAVFKVVMCAAELMSMNVDDNKRMTARKSAVLVIYVVPLTGDDAKTGKVLCG